MPLFQNKSVLIDFVDMPLLAGRYRCSRLSREIFGSKLRRELMLENPVWNYLFNQEWLRFTGLADSYIIDKGIFPQDMSISDYLEQVLIPDDRFFVMRLKSDVPVVPERGEILYKRESFHYYEIVFEGVINKESEVKDGENNF